MFTAIIGLFSGRTIRNRVILDMLKRQQESERTITALLRRNAEYQKKLGELERKVRGLAFNVEAIDPDTIKRNIA